MTERVLNVPLLRKAVEWVEEQDQKPWWRSEWHQEEWILSRGNYRYTSTQNLISVGELNVLGITEEQALEELNSCGTAYCVAGWIGATFGPEDYAWSECAYDKEHGAGMHVSDWAARELGLDEDQQRLLFHGNRTAAEIRYFAEKWTGEKL